MKSTNRAEGAAKKAILIGIDAAMPNLIMKFSKEGRLPNITRLMSEGVFSHALPTSPTHTPTNWTTIATGAYPGTHGIVGFADVHLPGEPLDKLHVGFDTRLCNAEYIWNAAENAGKRVIMLKYPASWPPTLKHGIQVEGYGRPAVHNPWLLGRACCYTSGRAWADALSGKAEYVREVLAYGHRQPTEVRFEPARGWLNLPDSHSPVMEGVLPVVASSKGNERRDFHCLMIDSSGHGYDKLLISPEKDASMALVTLAAGEWSKDIRTEFIIGVERVPAVFKFKLMKLAPDGKDMVLYQTQVNSARGWTVPDSLAGDLWDNVGGFLESTADAIIARALGWIDDQTYLEEYNAQASWLGRAAHYLTSRYEWDVLMTQVHYLDTTKHSIWSFCDPASERYDPCQADRYWEIMARNYEIADEYVGELMKLADEDTVMVVVSDHGHVEAGKPVMINNILARHGFISFEIDSTTGKPVIDWSRTRAYAPVSSAYGMNIFVNVKGRDPEGIVEPGEEYEKVREEILNILYGLVDPATGLRPVAAAFKKEDAAMVGLWGDRIGDIVWYRRPEYDTGRKLTLPLTDFGSHAMEGSSHGGEMPTASYSIGTINAMFVMAGPGVKKGYMRPKPITLVDVAPTMAYLLGIPAPANAEGRVLFDTFVDA